MDRKPIDDIVDALDNIVINNNAYSESHPRAIEHRQSNGMIDFLPPTEWYVIDAKTAEPEVNWQGDLIGVATSSKEAQRIRAAIIIERFNKMKDRFRVLRLLALDAMMDAAPTWGANLSVKLEEREKLAQNLGWPSRSSRTQQFRQSATPVPSEPATIEIGPYHITLTLRDDELVVVIAAPPEGAVDLAIRRMREPGEDAEEAPFNG